jgi:hypothetical protein
MSKYRVVEYKELFTGNSKFYIEKHIKFLWFHWWIELYYWHPEHGYFRFSYVSKESAQYEINNREQKIQKIIY